MKSKYRKQKTILLTVTKFVFRVLLISLSRFLGTKPQPEPTLQEIMMGEKLPMSDSYYIPDDKFHSKD